jgi:hypothetical protein
MENERFQLLSVEELRRKYELVSANRPVIHLNPKNVPEKLRRLVPLAELWGVGDDLIRDDFARSAPRAAIDELKRGVQAHETYSTSGWPAQQRTVPTPQRSIWPIPPCVWPRTSRSR